MKRTLLILATTAFCFSGSVGAFSTFQTSPNGQTVLPGSFVTPNLPFTSAVTTPQVTSHEYEAMSYPETGQNQHNGDAPYQDQFSGQGDQEGFQSEEWIVNH